MNFIDGEISVRRMTNRTTFSEAACVCDGMRRSVQPSVTASACGRDRSHRIDIACWIDDAQSRTGQRDLLRIIDVAFRAIPAVARILDTAEVHWTPTESIQSVGILLVFTGVNPMDQDREIDGLRRHLVRRPLRHIRCVGVVAQCAHLDLIAITAVRR